MTPHVILDASREADAHLALMSRAFASMEGKIDPPSSIHQLDRDTLTELPHTDALLSLGTPPIACVILGTRGRELYLSKLAVDPSHAGKGLGRALIDAAAVHAKKNGCAVLQAQTRVELKENHRFFIACGFTETARTSHPGYSRPTSITFERGFPQ